MRLIRLKAWLKRSAIRQMLWLLGVFSAISLLAWGATFVLVQHEMLRNVDARLLARMEEARIALDVGEAVPAPGRGETADLVPPPGRAGFQTRDAAGTETEMRYLTRETPQGWLRLGEDTELQEELRDILAGGMMLSFLATVVVAALMGVVTAQRSQARLNTINAGLAKVARGGLHTRISLEGEDDLSLLADRINAATAQLEAAMLQMRVQSSNIAHDLRTPLARLRAQLESPLVDATQRDHPLDRDILLGALEQIDRITATFDALLRLARIESGAGREAFAPVDLAALGAVICETFGPVVEDAGQSLEGDFADAETIFGDRDLLVQLVANLIQNALRHGAEHQTISLRIQGRQVSVSDQGPGIPVAQREDVLQPLYQRENTRQGEGAGLGLSLVRAIAELHQAELLLKDGTEQGEADDARLGGPGLCVAITFPAYVSG